jgi:hypothetical protein
MHLPCFAARVYHGASSTQSSVGALRLCAGVVDFERQAAVAWTVKKEGLENGMYLLTVILLMFVFPVGSIYAEHTHFHSAAPLMLLMGKWFVFWGAGVRLLLAGLRQFFQPSFTARQIFHIESDDALPIVRELGVANFATGIVGMISLIRPEFVLPVAISAGLFYGIAGIRHAAEKGRSGNENIAMISDLFVSAVFAASVVFLLRA